MAITRTTINGDITALKNALLTLVPTFFASVELNTNTINCKDANGNTVFQYSNISNYRTWTAYRSASSYAFVQGQSSDYDPKYFYTVGSNGAVIELGYRHYIIIAKTHDNKTGIIIPISVYTNGIQFTCYPVCWGDESPIDESYLTITGSAAPLIGNHCLFVPIPLIGTYADANYFPKAFFMPMSQADMRGVSQQITGASGVYLTNGMVALLDDSGV